MSNDGFSLQVETATAWAVQPMPDGKHTALVFRLSAGNIGVAMSNNDLGRYAERLIIEAGKLGENRFPSKPPETLAATPIPVNSLSIEPHPQDTSSALVAVQTGNIQIVFVMDVTMLRAQCTRLVERTHREKRRPAN